MALMTRVSRLFRADLHAVLDCVEEPDILLRQAVREMEEALSRDEQRLKRLAVQQGQLAARESELAQILSELDARLDVCFDSGKEDLARAVIRRRLEAERQARQLALRRAALAETVTGLGARVEDQRARLEAMRQKAEAMLPEDAAGAEPWTGPDRSVRDEDVEVAFLRERQRRTRP